jgi:hypothetical protein
MKIKGQVEKWFRVALGLLCLLLLVHLVMQFGGVRAGASRAPVPPAGSVGKRPLLPSSQGSVEELSRYDPVVRLDLLKQFQSRSLPRLARNPFEAEVARRAASPEVAPPPPVPQPPPIPLKALGYTEKGKGLQEAFVSDDEQTFVVHEGEKFDQKYRVLKITPKFIEIEDESSHQTIQLPFAQ